MLLWTFLTGQRILQYIIVRTDSINRRNVQTPYRFSSILQIETLIVLKTTGWFTWKSSVFGSNSETPIKSKTMAWVIGAGSFGVDHMAIYNYTLVCILSGWVGSWDIVLVILSLGYSLLNRYLLVADEPLSVPIWGQLVVSCVFFLY